MMDVLPTDWSPRKTSLYFAKGASVPPGAGFFAAVAVDGWAAFSLIVDTYGLVDKK